MQALSRGEESADAGVADFDDSNTRWEPDPPLAHGEVRPFVTTVSGSFDHRVIDGISRFIADVASVLEEPALLLD